MLISIGFIVNKKAFIKTAPVQNTAILSPVVLQNVSKGTSIVTTSPSETNAESLTKGSKNSNLDQDLQTIGVRILSKYGRLGSGRKYLKITRPIHQVQCSNIL